jgi:hypothetical protein
VVNTDTGGSTDAAKKADKGLWVDKYSPKKFNELLSEDKVNREVLHWIKAWDGVVFKKAPPKPTQWDLKQQQFAAQRDGGRGGDDRRRPRRSGRPAEVAEVADPPRSRRTSRSTRTDDRCTRFSCSRADRASARPPSRTSPRSSRGTGSSR